MPSLTTFVFAETEGEGERAKTPSVLRPTTVVLQSQLQLLRSLPAAGGFRAPLFQLTIPPLSSLSVPPWQTREQALKITISATADRPSERSALGAFDRRRRNSFSPDAELFGARIARRGREILVFLHGESSITRIAESSQVKLSLSLLLVKHAEKRKFGKSGGGIALHS